MRGFPLVTLLAFLTLYPAGTYAQLSSTDLKQYFSELPGGFFAPDKIDDPKWSDLHFLLDDQKHGISIASEAENGTNLTQNLFSLDILKFTHHENTEDFLDAKTRFYSRLKFDSRSQAHERPYAYLSGWMSLNHPPVKAIQDTPARIYREFSDPPSPAKINTYTTTAFQKKIDSISGTELTFDNETKALFNGESIKEKTALVRRSKQFILGAVMATICDPSSENFVQALMDQSRKGVTIKLLMERFYMGTVFRNCTNRLREAGIDLQFVNLKWKPKTLLSFFHPKFWVSDAEEVIVGGQNIASFENDSTGYNRLNRDTDLWIRGPVATDFADAFLKLWDRYSKNNLDPMNGIRANVLHHQRYQRMYQLRGEHAYDFQFSRIPNEPVRGACRAMIQFPRNQNLSIAEIMKVHAEHAEQSIVLTSPEIQFKIPARKRSEGDHLIASLIDAARDRAVKVELISNGVDGGNGEFTEFMREKLEKAQEKDRWVLADFLDWVLSFQPQHNARNHRRYLLQLARVPHFRTWTHFNYIHAKQAFFDRVATFISSVNLDQASMDRNIEAGALCMDEKLSRQMEAQLALDLANSTPVVSENE